MKKHLSYSLTVLLGLGYHLSRAQSHELVFKAGPASYSSRHGLLDPRVGNSKSVDKGFGIDLGYGHYFTNNNYLRLSGSYSATRFESKGTSTWGSGYNEWDNKLKVQSIGGNLEFGKRLSYKFIDFLAGLGAGYYVSPSYKGDEYSVSRAMPGSPNSSADNETRTVRTNPGIQVASLYLNTSLYFKIWKPLYLGVEVGNGFSFSKQKGDYTMETTRVQTNGSTSVDWEQQALDESYFTTRFFNTKLAVRYVFGAQKTAAVSGPTP